MSETHIHIHLNGESGTVAPKPSKAVASSKKAKAPASRPKAKRKPSAYSKRYGAAFKRVSKKHKKKGGGWKAGGFKRAQKEAHKIAKKG